MYRHADSHPRHLSFKQACSQPHSAPHHHLPNIPSHTQDDSCPNLNHDYPDSHLANQTQQYHQQAITSSNQYTTSHHRDYAGYSNSQQSSQQAKPHTNCTINAVANFIHNDSTSPIYQPLICCLCTQSHCHPERASAEQCQKFLTSHSVNQQNNQ